MIYCKKLILHFVIGKSEDIENNPLKGVRFSDFLFNFALKRSCVWLTKHNQTECRQYRHFAITDCEK
jgi:hypothetical protein